MFNQNQIRSFNKYLEIFPDKQVVEGKADNSQNAQLPAYIKTHHHSTLAYS